MFKKLFSFLGIVSILFVLMGSTSLAASISENNSKESDVTPAVATVSLSPTSQTVKQYGSALFTVVHSLSSSNGPFDISVNVSNGDSIETETSSNRVDFPGMEMNKKGTFTARALIIDKYGTAYASNSVTVVVN